MAASWTGSLEHESALPPVHMSYAKQRKSPGCDSNARMAGTAITAAMLCLCQAS